MFDLQESFVVSEEVEKWIQRSLLVLQSESNAEYPLDRDYQILLPYICNSHAESQGVQAPSDGLHLHDLNGWENPTDDLAVTVREKEFTYKEAPEQEFLQQLVCSEEKQLRWTLRSHLATPFVRLCKGNDCRVEAHRLEPLPINSDISDEWARDLLTSDRLDLVATDLENYIPTVKEKWCTYTPQAVPYTAIKPKSDSSWTRHCQSIGLRPQPLPNLDDASTFSPKDVLKEDFAMVVCLPPEVRAWPRYDFAHDSCPLIQFLQPENPPHQQEAPRTSTSEDTASHLDWEHDPQLEAFLENMNPDNVSSPQTSVSAINRQIKL